MKESNLPIVMTILEVAEALKNNRAKVYIFIEESLLGLASSNEIRGRHYWSDRYCSFRTLAIVYNYH